MDGDPDRLSKDVESHAGVRFMKPRIYIYIVSFVVFRGQLCVW
jgi:hypothetical protein